MKRKIVMLAAGLPLWVSASVGTDVSLLGTLVRNGDGYTLQSQMSHGVDANSGWKKKPASAWYFDALTLAPAFDTSRFECAVSKTVDGCSTWRNAEDRFTHINSWTSNYGDTPAQRKAKQESSVTREVIGMAIAAPIAVPILVFASPFMLLGKLTEKEKKYWVEFNHEDFTAKVQDSIRNAGFRDTVEYQDYVRSLADAYKEAKEGNDAEFLNVERKATELKNRVIGKNTTFSVSPTKFTIPTTLETRRDGNLIVATELRESLTEKIRMHYVAQRDAMKDLVEGERVRLVAVEAQQEAERRQRLAEQEAERRRVVAGQEAEQRRQEDAARRDKEKKMRDVQAARDKELQEQEKRRQYIDSLAPGARTACGTILERRGDKFKLADSHSVERWVAGAGIYSKQCN